MGSIVIGCLNELNKESDTNAFSASKTFSSLLNTKIPNDITETFLYNKEN
jgi:hypothetical protein